MNIQTEVIPATPMPKKTIPIIDETTGIQVGETEVHTIEDGKNHQPATIKETIQAPYNFSQEELIKLGKGLVSALQNEDQIENEFTAVKQQFKYRTEQAQLETGNIRSKLTAGFEMRPTLARIEFNKPTSGRKTYVDDVTGEPIRDEAMTAADFQPALIDEAEKPDDTEEGA